MKKRTLTIETTALICRELQLIVRSGVDAAGALALAAKDCGDAAAEKVLAEMVESLDSGLALDAALEKSGVFPGYVCALARVGRRSGKSEEAFAALADYYFRQAQLEKGLKNALLYPAMLILVMLAVIVVLFTRVLPMFEDVYERLGASMTGLASWMLALGRAMEALLPLFAAILAIFVLFLACFVLSDSFRGGCLRLWNRRRGDRGIARLMGRSRFAGALAMCLGSGMNPEEALALAALTRAGTPAEGRCRRCAEALAAGVGLGAALMEAQLLPAGGCHLLELAEKGGCADAVTAEIAERLARDADARLEETLGRVEPAMVLICCAIVACALLSVMLPLINIMSAIG